MPRFGQQKVLYLFILLRACDDRVDMSLLDDESQLAEFASYVGDLLISIVEENGLDLSSKQEDDDRLLVLTSPLRGPHPSHPILAPYRWKYALKLQLVRQLWIIVVNTLPASHLSATAEALFASIVKAEVNLVGADMDVADEVRDQWASLCAEVAYYCDEQEVLVFWGLKRGRRSAHHYQNQKGKRWNDAVCSFIWSHFLQRWREEGAPWESCAVLLGVPFL